MAQVRDFKDDFEYIVNNSRDMISIHDAEGIYLYANPAATELTGYAPSELIGKSAYDFFHPEDLKTAMRFIQVRINRRSSEMIRSASPIVSGTKTDSTSGSRP